MNNWVVIRVEASNSIGFGHMVRCFALASNLIKRLNVVFFTDSEFVVTACIKEGFTVLRCSDDEVGLELLRRDISNANIVSMVVDTKRAYSSDDVIRLKSVCRKVYFIENVSQGTVFADGVIFPAAHFDYDSVYGDSGLSISKEKIIFGEKYILIRDELMNCKVGCGGGVVVTTGASDPVGVMRVLDKILGDLKIKAHFLIGEKFESPLLELGKNHGSLYTQYSAKYISGADIVISAFGVSVYEALFFKKPTISIGHDLKNTQGSKIISQRTNMVRDLGFYREIDVCMLKTAINDFHDICFDSSLKIDSLGSERICQILLQE